MKKVTDAKVIEARLQFSLPGKGFRTGPEMQCFQWKAGKDEPALVCGLHTGNIAREYP